MTLTGYYYLILGVAVWTGVALMGNRLVVKSRSRAIAGIPPKYNRPLDWRNYES